MLVLLAPPSLVQNLAEGICLAEGLGSQLCVALQGGHVGIGTPSCLYRGEQIDTEREATEILHIGGQSAAGVEIVRKVHRLRLVHVGRTVHDLLRL